MKEKNKKNSWDSKLKTMVMTALPVALLVLGVAGYQEITSPKQSDGAVSNTATRDAIRRNRGPRGPRYGRGGGSWGKRAAKPAPLVETHEVKLVSFRPKFNLFGQIVARHRIDLHIPVPGYLTKTSPLFHEGGLVKKGDLLATVDDTEYQIALVEAKAFLQEAQAKVVETRAQMALEHASLENTQHQIELAGRNLARSQKLFKQGNISRKALDDDALVVTQRQLAVLQKKTAIDVAKARVIQFEAQVLRQRQAVVRAERKLQDTRLLAPFNGRILSANAEPGQYVTLPDRLATMVSNENLEVRFFVSEDQYGDILAAGNELVGLGVRIVWRSGQTTLHFSGMVVRLAPELDANSGSLIAFARLESENEMSQKLIIGSFVDVLLTGAPVENVAIVPESALLSQNRVFVVNNGRLAMRNVHPLAWDQGQVVISQGLKSGDIVVASHLPNAKPGMVVKVAQP